MFRIAMVVIAALLVAVGGMWVRYLVVENNIAESKSGVRIGGPFELTDHTGTRVSDADFRGEYMLVYFGYTYCPDVCPTSLSIIGDALERLDEDELAKLQPLFITVDPERDTADVLGEYVPHFHPKLIGLTGTMDEIRNVSRAYKAYFAKVNADDPDGQYLMDHSSFTYLMGPDGEYVTHFNHGTPPEKMAARLKEIL